MNADTLITSSALAQMHACPGAREWFARMFPDGAPLRVAWDACPRNDWRVWFACHALPKPAVERLAWKFAGQAFRFAAKRQRELVIYADNVGPHNWRKARNDAYDADTFAAAYAAADAAPGAGAVAAGYAAAHAADAADAADAAAYAREEQSRWCAEALFAPEVSA